MGKILSQVYEMLSCSPPQIILNTLTISSWLGSRSSTAEHKPRADSKLDFSGAAGEVFVQRGSGRPSWLALVAVCLLPAPALSLHLVPFLIGCSLLEASTGSILLQPGPPDKVPGLPDSYLQVRDISLAQIVNENWKLIEFFLCTRECGFYLYCQGLRFV